MSDNRDSPNNELDDVRRLVEEAWPVWSGPDDSLTTEDLVLAPPPEEPDAEAREAGQYTPEQWVRLRADELTREMLRSGEIRIGAPNVRQVSASNPDETARPRTRTPNPRGATEQQWVSMTRTWLLDKFMPIKRKYDGIAAVAPGEKKKPFQDTPNPNEGYFIPGRKFKGDPLHQKKLKEAHGAHQAEWAPIRATKEWSSKIFSVPAIAIYTSRLRDTGGLLLANIFCFCLPKENGPGYHNRAVINVQTLLKRTCPESRRRRADETWGPYRDMRGLKRQMRNLTNLDVIAYRTVERMGRPAYEILLLEGWQERLGPMPTMPSQAKTRIWRNKRVAQRTAQ